MDHYKIENEELTAEISARGAELRSLKDNRTGKEYMWSGDPEYWDRISPILFPVVGAYRDKTVQWQGKSYPMGQHGFARDMEFCLSTKSQSEIWFCLTDKENTLEIYPFAFNLEIGYLLADKTLRVMWRVTNPAEEKMYFSIGGHPAFVAPRREEGHTTCYLKFDTKNKIESRKIRNGLAMDEVETITLENGILPITEELFAEDALVIEHNQAHIVSLLDENKKEFMTVAFDAPLFGVWSPVDKNAPFICIEPWYGRCDREDYEGDITMREWGNSLEGGASFQASYTIIPQ